MLIVIDQVNQVRIRHQDQNESPLTFPSHVEQMTQKLEVQPDERIVWKLLLSKRNVLISGPAGSGKSHLVKRLRLRAKIFGKTSFTATTGIAAINVGSQTIYSALGLGIARKQPRVLWRSILRNKKKYRTAYQFLKTTKFLIIDEISMLNPTFLHTLDTLFRLARGCSSRSFGGVGVLMIGDFLQLGSINSTNVPLYRTSTWYNMEVVRVYLDRNFRQNHEDPLVKVLSQVRLGQPSQSSLDLLQSRIITKNKALEIPHCVFLYGRRSCVKSLNSSMMERVISRDKDIQRHTFLPVYEVYRCLGASERRRVVGNGIPYQFRDGYEKYFPVHHVSLCVGAQIMLRCNKYLHSHGLSNGSIGTVEDVETDVVQCTFGKMRLPVTRYEFKYQHGEEYEFIQTQFPLSLAWAMTIHKVQGMTLEQVCVDMSSCFAEGQVYTALSRVTSLSGLHLLNLCAGKIRVNHEALRFETMPKSDANLCDTEEQIYSSTRKRKRL